MPKLVLCWVVLVGFLVPSGAAAQIPPPELPIPPLPGQPQQPGAQQGELRASNTRPAPGETITVDGNCGQNNADQTVNFQLDGEGLQQNATTDDQGRFTARITIPEGRREGAATLTAICTGDGRQLTVQLQVERRQRAVAAERIDTGAGGAADGDGTGPILALLALLALGAASVVAARASLVLVRNRSS